MEQYISKDALVREIERQRNAYISEPGKYRVLSRILSFIDTLEVKVKEVDLEKEIDNELERTWYGEYLNTDKFKESALYFFELGLKAQKGE